MVLVSSVTTGLAMVLPRAWKRKRIYSILEMMSEAGKISVKIGEEPVRHDDMANLSARFRQRRESQ